MEQTLNSNINVMITQRDIGILRYLNEHKYMVKNQISSAFFPQNSDSADACQRRLDKLEEGGYVKKFEKSKELKQPRLYAATGKGIEELRKTSSDYGFEEVKSVDYQVLSHDLYLGNIRNVFEKLGAQNWMTERVYERMGGDLEFIPDAVFSSGKELIAIEFENSLKEQTKYQVKFNWYQEKSKFLLCLYLVNGDAIRNKLRDFETIRSKIAFISYSNLLTQKGNVVVENHEAQMRLEAMFQ